MIHPSRVGSDRGSRGRSGLPRDNPRYGLLLLVLTGTYLLAAFSGAKLAADVQIILFAVVLLLALRTSPLPGRWPVIIGAITVIGTTLNTTFNTISTALANN